MCRVNADVFTGSLNSNNDIVAAMIVADAVKLTQSGLGDSQSVNRTTLFFFFHCLRRTNTITRITDKITAKCVTTIPCIDPADLSINIWAQYGIDLPGSLHTNKILAILGRYPLLGFFCRLNIVPLDRDNGTSNSSNTDVVEKVNFLVAASQHGGTSVVEGSP